MHPDDIRCEACGITANCSDPTWNAAFTMHLEGTYCATCVKHAVEALGLMDAMMDEEISERIEDWLEQNRQKPM